MTIAIMQPYIFPYIGYYQLINKVDKFIIYDDVNYINKGWINRNNILVNGSASKFTIPLQNATQNSLIAEIAVSIDSKWIDKFFKTIEQSYKKAPYYHEVAQLIQNTFSGQHANISQLATQSLVNVNAYLGIDTEIVPTSAIYNNAHLKAQHRILDIVLTEHAERYINPIGGQEIYSRQLFLDNHVDLKFIKTHPIEYKQFNQAFVPNLSIIDVLMFNSKEEMQAILNKFELV